MNWTQMKTHMIRRDVSVLFAPLMVRLDESLVMKMMTSRNLTREDAELAVQAEVEMRVEATLNELGLVLE